MTVVEEGWHEGLVLAQHHPFDKRRYRACPLLRYSSRVDWQPDIHDGTRLVISHHFRAQDLRYALGSLPYDFDAIAHDRLLASADLLPELQRCRHAQIRRVVHRADELEHPDEWRLGAGGQRVVDLLLPGSSDGLIAVRSRHAGPDQALIPLRDVQHGAAAGDI